MTSQQLTGRTAVVTGASRGFGRAIATALTEAGAAVVGLARDGGRLAELGQNSATRSRPWSLTRPIR